MKIIFHLFLSLVIAIPVSTIFIACSDSLDRPDFVPPRTVYNQKDSAAFCEVMKAALGPSIAKFDKLKLDDIQTWIDNDFVKWKYYDDIKENRIWIMSLDDLLGGTSPDYKGYISSDIWDLDSLVSFSIARSYVHGSFPSPEGRGKNLQSIVILYSFISELPLDLFTLPNLIHMQIEANPHLTKLPEGFELLPKDTKRNKTRYLLDNNSFTGKVPVNPNLTVDLRYNKFTEIDWEEWNKIDFSYYYKKEWGTRLLGPYLQGNKIRGKIPDSMKKDTLAMIYTSRLLLRDFEEIESYNMIEGLWQGKELDEVKEKYFFHHPDHDPDNN